MRLFYWIRFKFQEWNYKRKYGISIYDAMKEYGKYIVLSEKSEQDDQQ